MKKLFNVLSATLFSLTTTFTTEVLAAVDEVPGYAGLASPTGSPLDDGFYLGFGDDDRVPMTSDESPWTAIGRVQINGGGHCTGSLIGKDLVLTNAHCIFKDRKLVGASFAPNYKDGKSAEIVKGISYKWGTNDPSNFRDSDWAIITLARPISSTYGSLGLWKMDYSKLKNRKVIYAGYSSFANETIKIYEGGKTAQVHIGCTVRDTYPKSGVIHTDCDNGTGGSGGPVFVHDVDNSDYIVAINAADHRGDAKQSYFQQNYVPDQGNVAVPTLAFFNYDENPIPKSPSGFYRENGTSPVYLLNKDNSNFCHVVNEDQMNLFGGFSKVKVVNNHDFRVGVSFYGECTVQKGYYRQNGTSPVYYVDTTNKQFCNVVDPAQMYRFGGFNQVQVVKNSGFKAGLTNIGYCKG